MLDPQTMHAIAEKLRRSVCQQRHLHRRQGLRFQPFQDLDAGQARHPHVHDEQIRQGVLLAVGVRPKAAQVGNDLHPILHLVHHLQQRGVSSDDLLQQEAVCLVIVGDQNPVISFTHWLIRLSELVDCQTGPAGASIGIRQASAGYGITEVLSSAGLRAQKQGRARTSLNRAGCPGGDCGEV
jgi:hypothetical protein